MELYYALSLFQRHLSETEKSKYHRSTRCLLEKKKLQKTKGSGRGGRKGQRPESPTKYVFSWYWS